MVFKDWISRNIINGPQSLIFYLSLITAFAFFGPPENDMYILSFAFNYLKVYNEYLFNWHSKPVIIRANYFICCVGVI